MRCTSDAQNDACPTRDGLLLAVPCLSQHGFSSKLNDSFGCKLPVRFKSSRNSCSSAAWHLRFQPVDATHWLNRSAGVSKFNVSLGLSLSRLATAFSRFWWTFERSIPFGKYCRSRPLVFSLELRCQGLCGSQK